MPVISRTKIQKLGGPTMDALVVGQSLSGRIILNITKDILFSYWKTDGSATVEEGISGAKCYRVTHEPHILHWKAKIHIRTEKTVRSVIRRFIHGAASDVEQAGAVVTAAGGTIVVAGGVVAASGAAVPPSVPATATAGASIATFGGIVSGIGGILWGGAAFVKWLVKDKTTVDVTDKHDSGTKNFESVKVEQIECLPDHTYTSISLPKSKSASEAENDAVVEVLGELGF